METERAKCILDRYVVRWNEVVAKWRDPEKRLSLLETDPFLRLFGNRLSLKLMPEPFWGKTREASVVVANYNSAGYDEPNPRARNDNGHYASWRWFVYERTGTYGDFAESLPVFGKLPPEWRQFENYKGRTKFWGSRIAWADRIVSGLRVDAGTRRPVGMELCGWHSEHWDHGSDDTGTLLTMERVDELVLEPFEAALTLSSARLGLCVGAGYERVLERMRFERVQGWGQFPVYKVDGKLVARSYALYQKGNLRVLVTKSRAGRQTCPGEHFASHEIGLLSGAEHLPVPARSADNPGRRGSAAPKEKRLVQVLEGLKTAAREEFPACHRGAADNVLVLCEDAGAGWRLSVSVTTNGSDMKLEVHATDRAGRESLKRRVSTLSDTTLPGAWKKCRIGGRGSLAVASFKMNAFDKARPDFASMFSAAKSLLDVLQGGR